MKRTIIVLLTAFIFCSLSISRAYAVNISIGPVAWYAWWDPAFEKNLTAKAVPGTFSSWENPAKFMYGPMLSIGWGNWNVSSVFMVGQYNMSSQGITTNMGINPFVNSEQIWKYDLDSSLSYRINDIVKVYAGFKYQHYSWSINFISQGGTNTTYVPRRDRLNTYNAGFGIALTFRLVENLYLTCNISLISGMYVIKDKSTYYFIGTPNPPIGGTWKTFSSPSVGGNGVLTLAYYFDSLSTTISLGARYQYIRIWKTLSPLESKRDQFYGITLSAVYVFSF